MSEQSSSLPRIPGAPIWLQILALVVGALFAAQLVTLGLTVLLPPSPPQQHSLTEIAQALRGRTAAASGGRTLIRTLEAAPPSLESPGWVVSPHTTNELAGLLDVAPADVRILFYAPPPLAGTTPPPAPGTRLSRREGGGSIALAGFLPAPDIRLGRSDGAFELAQTGPPSGIAGGPPPGPMGAAPGAFGRGGFGPGGLRPGEIGPGDGVPHRVGRTPAGPNGAWPVSAAASPHAGAYPARGPELGRGSRGAAGAPAPDPGAGPTRPMPPLGPTLGRLPHAPLDAAVFDRSYSIAPEIARPAEPRPAEPTRPTAVESIAAPTPAPTPAPAPAAVETAAPAASEPPAPMPALAASAEPAGAPLAAPVAPSLFGLTRPSAYVEGEFVAALRSPQGWITVRPQPEGFPNSWQRRVLLWFALSLALVAPPAYLLARRLVRPLQQFAETAERLGREPTADLPPLEGPAEIGRAASAFNLMRLRLKRYVEDRTGMISAITHDLRTPLARMRFKLERTPPAQREALARDVDQMEAMIASVLSFMRDELSGSEREFADIRSVLECVVDEAGDRAELEPGPPANAHVDLLGIQRVFENLVSNAIKYGVRARVRMLAEGEDLVIEVADEGPGLPDSELEAVFKPFYRSAQARNSGAPGVGLGLAVSRSILRAHGGDLTLASTEQGLIARARLPLASTVRQAA